MISSVLASSDLSIGYRLSSRKAHCILRNLNLELRAGEFVCVLGPNGCGKSTLLRSLAGFQPALSGSIQITGDDLRHLSPQVLARRLSVVLTGRVQVGAMSVFDLVGLGRYPHTGRYGHLKERDIAVIQWALAATGSADLATRNTSELSDGELQRVMIARSLAQEPQIVILDEPTAFLDLPRRVGLTSLLRTLAHESGLAVLLTTHDLDLALRTADHIWLVTSDRRVVVGAPEDLVLAGDITRAFSGREFIFDSETGGFRAVQNGAPQARVRSCRAVADFWTRRALERVGFECLTDPSSMSTVALDVECIEIDSTTRWRASGGNLAGDFGSLDEVARVLRDEMKEVSSSSGR